MYERVAGLQQTLIARATNSSRVISSVLVSSRIDMNSLGVSRILVVIANWGIYNMKSCKHIIPFNYIIKFYVKYQLVLNNITI